MYSKIDQVSWTSADIKPPPLLPFMKSFGRENSCSTSNSADIS